MSDLKDALMIELTYCHHADLAALSEAATKGACATCAKLTANMEHTAATLATRMGGRMVCRECGSAYRPGDIVLIDPEEPVRKFTFGQRVTKTKGSKWTGHIVGFYSTDLTPVGYAIESENEPGSVQIYPESAIAAILGEG